MSKIIKIGNTKIGGGNPISIQSMLNVHNSDADGNIAQAMALESAGCEIIRVAVPNMEAVRLIPAIKSAVKIPLVADIHFDYRLAVESAAAGVDKIRINPGNIGEENNVKAVVQACRARGIPIRIGVNSGSLEKEILTKYEKVCPEALVESARRHIELLEKFDFYDIVVSIKSSDV
ncbi:MAG: flavodoxin-dependent (E)-4-hydroxy-3-methylbut-2-enyl-diphosphate synthase, partial [Oscillospiraceae bacterium]